MNLSAATYLGPNTTPILAALADQLGLVGVSVYLAPQSDLTADPPDLVWACGLLTAEVIRDGGPLSVVAAPVFEGETDAVYRSVVVTRAELEAADLTALVGRRLAVNEYGSWSGYRALARELAVRGMPSEPAEVFSAVVVTGSHVDSVESIVAGRADVAAIDHTVWNHICSTTPEAVSGLVVVDHSRDWPAPPFSISRRLPSTTARMLIVALTQPPVPGLERIQPASVDDYRMMVA